MVISHIELLAGNTFSKMNSNSLYVPSARLNVDVHADGHIERDALLEAVRVATRTLHPDLNPGTEDAPAATHCPWVPAGVAATAPVVLLLLP